MSRTLTKLLLLAPLMWGACDDDEGVSRTTWSFPETISEDLAPPANSDIRISSSLSIPAEHTLTLAAGCKLIFENNSSLQIHGGLWVNGTAGNPVRFVSAEATASEWSCVVDLRDGAACEITQLKAEGGYPALWIQSGAPLVDGFSATLSPYPLKLSAVSGGSLRHLSLTHSGRRGIGVETVDCGPVLLEGLSLSGFQYGTFLNNGSQELRHLSISDCEVGLLFSHSAGSVEDCLVKDGLNGCRYIYTASTDVLRAEFRNLANGVQLHSFVRETGLDELNFVATPIAFRYLTDAYAHAQPIALDYSGHYYGTTDSAAIDAMVIDAVDLGEGLDTLRFMPPAATPWTVTPTAP